MAKGASTRKVLQLPRWVGIALLAALAALTVVAVVLAVTQAREPNPNAGTAPMAAMPTVEKTAEPEPAPAEPVEAPEAPTMQRLLSVHATGGHLLRATVGACPTPEAGLERSDDNGATWQPSPLANAGGVTRLLQLNLGETDVDRFVAVNADCAPVAARSFTGGVDWEPADAEGQWFIDPADATLVHGSAAAAHAPCTVVGLSSVGDRAIALCLDSSVIVSGDGGASWSAPVAVPSAVAVGATPSQFVVASAAEAECAGVRTRTFDGAALGAPGGCVDVADAGGGNTAVAGSDAEFYLWAGGAFLRSSDAGGSWS